MTTTKGLERKEGLNITEIELDNNGNPMRLKGTYTKPKRKTTTNERFSPKTNKVIIWAELELEYMGG